MTNPTRPLRRLALLRAATALGGLLAVAGATQAQPSAQVSLDDAIALARQQAPQVRAAARRADAARQAADVTPWLTNPSLEVRMENWGAGSRESLAKDLFLVATQPIEFAGRASQRRAVATATAAVAEADLAQVHHEHVLGVIRGYLDVVRARDSAALMEDQAARLDRAVATMRARVAEGVSAEGDLRRLESEAVRLTIAVQRRLVERDQAAAALGLWLGRPVDASQVAMPGLGPAVALPSTDDLVDRHPLVASARVRASAADAMVAFEASQRIPVLLVSGGYKRTSGVSTGVAALGLTLPVFDRHQAARRKTEGEAAAAHLEFDAWRAAARADVAVQRATAERLAKAATNLDATLLEPARIARDAAYAAVLEGAADVVKLVDADRAYADARLDALALITDAIVAQRRFALLTGSE